MTRDLFQRYWPVLVTVLIGVTLATCAGYFVGLQIQDKDTRVIVTFAVSAFAGLPTGVITALVWVWRSPL